MKVLARGAPLMAPGFRRMVERAGVEANLGINVHAHMLRHATVFKLANDGRDTRAIQSYMGHMCGRLQVGKENLHVAGLVGAAMCSAFECGSHDRWP
jgi:hypothetical protein